MEEIKGLAQDNYDYDILRLARKELAFLETMEQRYPKRIVESVYENMIPERQHLITPIRPTDAEAVAEFLSRTYSPLPFRANDYTHYILKDGKTRVRSKSEKILGDLFIDEEVPALYECPLELPGFGTVRPDFTLLNVRTRKVYFWEHAGLAYDPEYVRKNLPKYRAYQRAGLLVGEQVIVTAECESQTLDVEEARQLVRHYLK